MLAGVLVHCGLRNHPDVPGSVFRKSGQYVGLRLSYRTASNAGTRFTQQLLHSRGGGAANRKDGTTRSEVFEELSRYDAVRSSSVPRQDYKPIRTAFRGEHGRTFDEAVYVHDALQREPRDQVLQPCFTRRVQINA